MLACTRSYSRLNSISFAFQSVVASFLRPVLAREVHIPRFEKYKLNNSTIRSLYVIQNAVNQQYNCLPVYLFRLGCQPSSVSQRVKRKEGDRSPIGARVFPVSHNSWYFSTLPSRRPSALALFSHRQYILYDTKLINVGKSQHVVALTHSRRQTPTRLQQSPEQYCDPFCRPGLDLECR